MVDGNQIQVLAVPSLTPLREGGSTPPGLPRKVFCPGRVRMPSRTSECWCGLPLLLRFLSWKHPCCRFEKQINVVCVADEIHRLALG